jgi:hypothetical protein
MMRKERCSGIMMRHHNMIASNKRNQARPFFDGNTLERHTHGERKATPNFLRGDGGGGKNTSIISLAVGDGSEPRTMASPLRSIDFMERRLLEI